MVDPEFPELLSYRRLMHYTDNFSEVNFLGAFQFGKVYRGEIDCPSRLIMVKMWEVSETTRCSRGDNESRVMLEIMTLQSQRLNCDHGMLELFGYCWDNKHLGIVYTYNPMDTLHNLVPKDSFTWLQRIKVALRFAGLLKLLHSSKPPYMMPFVVRNIGAAHIVLDEQYNPKLLDFSMISGGLFSDTTECYGCYGYIDPHVQLTGNWSTKTDVFAFGVILLNLITKEIDRETRLSPICDRAWDLYQPCEYDAGSKLESLVHESLVRDRDFYSTDGLQITKLAMKCINRYPDERPTMRHVVLGLLKLQVVEKHGEYLGLASKRQARVDG